MYRQLYKIMNKFIGTKEVKARPLNLRAYNKLRGWEIPKDENPDTEGYLVEYLDSPNANHPDYDNYISWSPKDVFERSYKLCDTFLDRLKNEARELAIKTNALNDFMRTQAFVDLDRQNKDLLYKQSRLMNEYLQVLGQRIEILGDKFSFKD